MFWVSLGQIIPKKTLGQDAMRYSSENDVIVPSARICRLRAPRTFQLHPKTRTSITAQPRTLNLLRLLVSAKVYPQTLVLNIKEHPIPIHFARFVRALRCKVSDDVTQLSREARATVMGNDQLRRC